MKRRCFKEKLKGSFSGLRLTDQMLKTVERIFVKLIKHIIDINEIESGFMPGPLDAIFILSELQVD